MDSLDAYLDELVTHLDCDPLRRDEIRLEVHAHLRENAEAEANDGKNAGEATQAAIGELGPAAAVARRLTGGPGRRQVAPLGIRLAAIAMAWVVSRGAFTLLDPLVRGAWLGLVSRVGYPSDPFGPGLVIAVLVAQFGGGALPAFTLWAVSRRPWDAWLVCVVWAAMWSFAVVGDRATYRGERLAELTGALAVGCLGMLVTAHLFGRLARRRDPLENGCEARLPIGLDQIDAYVSEVVSHLGCDPLRRDEIRLEVHAHLKELVAVRQSQGMAPPVAVDAAIREFGPVGEVAEGLTLANRGRPSRPLGPVTFGTRAGAVAIAWIAFVAADTGLLGLGNMIARALGGPERPEPPSLDAAIIWGTAYVLGGAFAAFLIWLISRRPWDVVFLCAATAPIILAARTQTAWSHQTMTDITALFVGAMTTALLLSRHRVKPSLFGRGL